MFDRGEYKSEHDAQLREEKIDINKRLTDMINKRKEPEEHCVGDTEPDELYYESDNQDNDSDCYQLSDVELQPEPVHQRRNKLNPVKKGPTERSHFSGREFSTCILYSLI